VRLSGRGSVQQAQSTGRHRKQSRQEVEGPWLNSGMVPDPVLDGTPEIARTGMGWEDAWGTAWGPGPWWET
jgi:hypothetical protein